MKYAIFNEYTEAFWTNGGLRHEFDTRAEAEAEVKHAREAWYVERRTEIDEAESRVVPIPAPDVCMSLCNLTTTQANAFHNVAAVAVFMMEGFRDHCKTNEGYSDLVAPVSRSMGTGVAELMEQFATFALEGEKLFRASFDDTEGAPGVWLYEVASEFGAWYAAQLDDKHDAPSHDDAMETLCRIDAKFWDGSNQLGNVSKGP
jgi:hypothetical protein